MKRERAWKIFGKYIGHHKKTLGLLALFGILFFVILYLYKLPQEAVLYWGVLCLFFGGIGVGIDFRFYLKRHRELVRLQREITLGVDLPAPRNVIEEDYTALINILSDQRIDIENKSQEKAKEMADYYTLWAHQIKTPIAALRLLLKAREDGDALYPELFKIEQYVEMVLQYLRFESVTTDYCFKRQDLGKIVRQAAKKFAPLFVSKRIGLRLGDLDAKVLTDEKWLSFVIEQILSNALKYTQKGSISIFLEGDSTLVIQDTGIGIAEEDLPRICEKSYTGMNGREDKGATGLGLYLCRQILEKLSHSMEITSKLKEGTRVTIQFDQERI